MHFYITVAVQFRNSYGEPISNKGGFSESELVVFTSTLNQDLFDYADADVELVVPLVDNAAAVATHLICLQIPTPDALTRSGDYGGHMHSARHFAHPSCMAGIP
jgi:hypothetical protein